MTEKEKGAAMNRPDSFWSQERMDQVTQLWNVEQKTATQILALPGFEGVTRSALMGKVHRMKLKKRTGEERTPRVYVISEQHREKIRLANEQRAAERKGNVITAFGTPTKPEHMQAKQCRWPIGDPKDSDFHFCAAPCGNFTYCTAHEKCAYASPKKTLTQS